MTTIVEVIKTKKLNTHFIKIKGHSGDIFNNLADLKAKEGSKSTKYLNPEALYMKGHKIRYTWEGKLVEKPIRSFVKMVRRVLLKAEWTFLHNKHDKTHQERKSTQSWSMLHNILRGGTKQRNHTFKSNALQLFETKCINNMLPVFEKLNWRRPETYKTDKCVICKKEKENVEHLVSCETSLNLLRDLEEQVVEATLLELKKVESMETTKEEVLIMLGKGSQDKESRRRERWIRGLITKEDFDELRPLFNSNNQVKNFLDRLWKNWIKEVHERIWVARCKLVQEWEKENEIMPRDKKRSYEKTIRKRGKKKKPPDKRIKEKEKDKDVEEDKRWKSILEITKKEVLRWIEEGQWSDWWKSNR